MTHSIFTPSAPFNGSHCLRRGATGLLPCFMANSAFVGLCKAELRLGRGTGIVQACHLLTSLEWPHFPKGQDGSIRKPHRRAGDAAQCVDCLPSIREGRAGPQHCVLWEWWHMPVTVALRRQGQGDKAQGCSQVHNEFEDSLGYVRPRLKKYQRSVVSPDGRISEGGGSRGS